MPHMRPQYTDQAFLTGQTMRSDGFSIPLDAITNDETATAAEITADMVKPYLPESCTGEPDPETFEIVSGQWFARLSAPGYLDCTEWEGPYATRQEAEAAIEEAFDVDPITGEEANEG